MSISTAAWTDNNRFNQTGYSASTLFPREEDYVNKMLYMEDLDKAEQRELVRDEWLEELRMDAQDEQQEMQRVRDEEDCC